MTMDDVVKFAVDARAFVLWCEDNIKDRDERARLIVDTLMHDVGGLVRQERCFSPRVTGYADKN